MKKILLVENQLNLKKVIERWLLKEGYEVVGCASGETALDLIKTGDFSVVITDYKMRRVSGLTIARIAKSRKPPIPVFIVSAYAEGFIISSCVELPDKIFSKPID